MQMTLIRRENIEFEIVLQFCNFAQIEEGWILALLSPASQRRGDSNRQHSRPGAQREGTSGLAPPAHYRKYDSPIQTTQTPGHPNPQQISLFLPFKLKPNSMQLTMDRANKCLPTGILVDYGIKVYGDCSSCVLSSILCV